MDWFDMMVGKGNAPLAFPSRTSLWPNCLLLTIAHAVFVLRAPFLAHEHSWDGSNYNVKDTQGAHGTIAFGEDRSVFVAAVYSHESERAGPNPKNVTHALFQGIPDDLAALRDEALQYVLQDVDGAKVPVVTAAFWSDLTSSLVTACEPWADTLAHGAELFQTHFDELNAASSFWADDYGFDESEVTLTFELFNRRLAAVGPMNLRDGEIRLLRQRPSKEGGLECCRDLLRDVGIGLP